MKQLLFFSAPFDDFSADFLVQKRHDLEIYYICSAAITVATKICRQALKFPDAAFNPPAITINYRRTHSDLPIKIIGSK
ncbi:MAG: hypothetical protein ABW161_14075 [Candidatus Thiodiazotropha sp.]